MDIHRKIEALRNRKGLTQQALADLMGVTHKAVFAWEHTSRPRKTKLHKLSEIFGVNPVVLMEDSEPLPEWIPTQNADYLKVVQAMKAELAESSAVWAYTDGRLPGLLVNAKAELPETNYEILLSFSHLLDALGSRIKVLEERSFVIWDALEKKGFFDDEAE